MRNWLYIVLLASSVCVGQIATGVRVDDVKFVSDHSVSAPMPDQCAKRIRNQDFEGPDWRDEATERVVSCLQDNGYYKATVIPEFQQLPDHGKTHHFSATMRIGPGRQYRIAEIRVRGREAYDISEIKPLLGMAPGDIFARKRIRDALERLREFYGHKGYINFTPLPEVDANDAEATVVLSITMDAGRQYHVGGVEFSGVSSEDAAQLAGRFEGKKGDIFDGGKIEESVSKFFRENKNTLPKGATMQRNFSVLRDDATALVYLRFDFAESGYLRK